MEDQPVTDLGCPQNRTYVRVFLLVLFVIVFYVAFRIFQPFLGAMALATVFASLLYPYYLRTLRLFRGRASLAALTICILFTCLVLIPFLFMVLALAGQVGQVYVGVENWVRSGDYDRFMNETGSPFFSRWTGFIEQYVNFQELDLSTHLASALKAASVFLLQNSTAVLGGFFYLVGQFFLTVVTLFFFLRDGDVLVASIRSMTALSGRYEDALVGKFREVTRATVLGTIVTASSQGAAGGCIFLLIGIPNALFWGALIGLFSMVPVVGAAVIWVPWSVYLLLSGATARGIILAVACIGIVGMLDNIVRPAFIQGKAGMHTLVVFFSLMGGVACFGVTGLIFGPILVSVFLTLLELYRIEFRTELNKPEA